MKWIFSGIFGIIGIFFLVFGCPFAVAAGGLYYYMSTATQDWTPVTATVTGMTTSQSNNDGSYTTTYCPTVEYTTTSGETVEVNVNECSFPAAYSTGDSVEILYNPQDVQSVHIEGGTGDLVLTIFVFVFGGLGVLFCIIGGGMILISGIAALWRSRNPTSITG